MAHQGQKTIKERFQSGTFRGVPVDDTFAAAASQEEPVIVDLQAVPWPAGLQPQPVALGSYKPGTKITGALEAQADALIVLYTEYETSALLDAFTGNNEWNPARKKTWCGYGHNFATFKPDIENIGDDVALKDGMFGYLSAMKIGSRTVVLYKSELHPKQNGSQLPFIPVMQQLIGELAPPLVITTGTAGGIGSHLNCGDVAITRRARFHTQGHYPNEPDIATRSANGTELTSNAAVNVDYVQYAAENMTKLSLKGCRSATPNYRNSTDTPSSSKTRPRRRSTSTESTLCRDRSPWISYPPITSPWMTSPTRRACSRSAS